MASTTFAISCTTVFPSKTSSSLPYCLNVSPNPRRRQSKLLPRAAAASSSPSNDQTPAAPAKTVVDRRNVLLGLGGLYGALNISPYKNNNALASPVPAPNLETCTTAIITSGTDKDPVPVPYSCCPPKYTGVVKEYQLPTFSRPNVRPAAHAMQAEQLEKYKTAVQRMRDLPDDDPRSLYQQANVHCAYCNGAYKLGSSDVTLQVHASWLFFPFHRWYLYFHERILQSLIGDPTLTIPFWNWDNPKGMYLPEIFDESTTSPLYDSRRNQDHRSGFLLDLNYSGSTSDAEATSDVQTVCNNLAIMYRQMVTNATSPSLFFGGALRAEGYDEKASREGSIENTPHTQVHIWAGDTRTDHHEDMGNFYSAGRDPLFYSHHSNVDRMWCLWKKIGGNHRDLTDSDWLQSEFLFYDENKDLVKVKVQDCLENEKLGYTFQDVAIPWLKSRPTMRNSKPNKLTSGGRRKSVVPAARDVLPTELGKNITFTVERPKTGRTAAEKGEEEELLELGFTYDITKFIRFDVFINEDNNVKSSQLDRAEYLGGFGNLAHTHQHSAGKEKDPNERLGMLRLSLTEALEDLELEFDRTVNVTVVPKCNGDFLTVNSAEVKLVASQEKADSNA